MRKLCQQIETKKIDLKVESKIGSLENVKHRPGGGDKKIFDDKDYLKQMSAISSENQSLSGSQVSDDSGPIFTEKLLPILKWTQSVSKN